VSPTEDGKLSTFEVEALLEATKEEEPSVERPEPTRRVHAYDFLQPSRFNKADLESLRKINDGLTQNITAQASRLLRTSIKAQLVSMEQMKWENFLDEAAEGAVGFVLTLEPLGHQGVLTIERQFAAMCLDRMLGGPGLPAEADDQFAGTDVRAFACLARALLAPLPDLWQNIGQFQVVLGAFVQDLGTTDLLAPEEDLFQLCFLLQGSIGSGQVSLSVPFLAVKSLPPRSEEGEVDRSVAASDAAAKAGLRENLNRAPVELAVVLGATDVRVQDLVGVEPGDVIVLNTRLGDPLDVRLNDVVKLQGYPGTSKGKYAVKLITEE